MKKKQVAGILAAFSSAFFLGLAPIFGKLAFSQGFSPLAVVALRTSFAVIILATVILLFYRPYLYIFPVGLAGCLLAGAINGLGSVLYYFALERLNASVGQLLYSLYPLFVAFWLLLDHQPPSRLTFLRISIAAVAVLLLTSVPERSADPLGVLMMLGSATLYAMHLPINQRVLFEAPAPTVALYTLLAMSAVVVPAYLLFDRQFPAAPDASWAPILGLTSVTVFSRLTLFLGVKKIGGMQTALLGLAELLVTVIFSGWLLGENLSLLQWTGAAALSVSLGLALIEAPTPPARGKTGWLSWIRAPGLPKDVFGPYE